jgi:hypothetical protein
MLASPEKHIEVDTYIHHSGSVLPINIRRPFTKRRKSQNHKEEISVEEKESESQRGVPSRGERVRITKRRPKSFPI